MAEEPKEIVTQATDGADIGDITNEAELNKFLNPDDKGKETDDKSKDESTSLIDENGNLIPPKELTEEEKKIEEEKIANEKSEKDKGTETEYDNMVQFLDKKYDLKLNLDQLPDDLSREQEAEVVGGLYDKVIQNANAKIAQYQRIDEILKDQEVKDFITAKKDGKTLKDYAIQYAGSTAGKSDEEIVKDSIKRQFPTMKEEDVEDTLSGYRERNKIGPMAEIARAAVIENEKNDDITKEKVRKDQEILDEKDRVEDVNTYRTYIGNIKDVQGIPIDAKMKNELFVAATQPDEKGLTYLDRALQSDEGVLRATLGLLHLERLIQAGKTTDKNIQRANLVDKLLADPKELGNSSHVQHSDGFDPTAADTF